MLRHRTIFGLLLLAGFSSIGGAQEVYKVTENLDSDRPEAWALNYFSSVTLISGLSVPQSREPGSIDIALELGRIPQLSESERTIGFDGYKVEDLNKAPVFGRPRVTIGLPWDSALILSYVPPVRVFGLKPSILTVGLERPLYQHGAWSIGGRLYGQYGVVKGAFTCPDEVTDFPPGSPENEYGCETQSNDKSSQHYAGFELSASYRMQRFDGLTSYVAVARNYLNTKAEVRAETYGYSDRSRLDADTWTTSINAGFIYAIDKRYSFSVGAFYTPLEVTRAPSTSTNNDPLIHLRAMLNYRFR